MSGKPDSFSPAHTSLQASALCATVAAIFVLAHPYSGIVQDNVLYVAQALLRLNPDVYGSDAFFQWGSQDRYTLFSPIFAWLILHIGLERSNIGLLVISQCLFLAGSFALVTRLVPQGFRCFAMLFIVSSIGLYGGLFLFRMAEPFVTPRPFVEAGTLFAIALLIVGRRGGSLALLALGAPFHPIMAICGALYCWIYLVLEDRRWSWLLGLAIVPLAMGLAGVVPFVQLFQAFDQRWLDIISVDNANLFVTQWTHFDWGLVVFDGAVLFIGMNCAAGVTRRAFQAALITAVTAVAATFIGADVMHNVLLTSLQPWRALWLVHWMAACATTFVAWTLWGNGGIGRILTALLVFGFITRGLPTSAVASMLAVAIFAYRDRFAVSARVANIAVWGLCAGAFANWLGIVLHVYQLAAVESVNFISDFTLRAFSKPFPLVVLGGAIVLGLRHQRYVLPTAVGGAAFLLLAVLFWDQRLPFRVYIESTEVGSHPFASFVKPNQQVLWHGNATAPWIMMKRRSYFSDTQMAGQVYSREMALEFARRKKAMAILGLQQSLCGLMNSLNDRYDSCQPDLETVRALCREAGDLDFIVLESQIADKWLTSWTLPVAVGGRRQYYYLYGCKNVV